MGILDLLTALALLLWGGRQLHGGVAVATRARFGSLVPAAKRRLSLAFVLGLASGILQPSARPLPPASCAWPGDRAFAVLLGANVGAAATMLLLLHVPPWTFHALTIAGAGVTLLARDGRLRAAGRALFGTGLVLLALGILGLAASSNASLPVAATLAPALDAEPLLCATAGVLLVLCLRSVFPAVLLLASTWPAWLTAQAAVAVLAGLHAGAALLAHESSRPDASLHRVGVAQLGCALLVAAGALLLQAELGQWVEAHAHALPLLNLAMQVVAAAAFLNLAGPLLAAMRRWLPAPPAAAAGSVAARLPGGAALDDPSVALTAALRELMRLADLVDRMLQMTRDVFLHDAGAGVAANAVRDAERRVNASYLALKQFLAKVARRPLSAGEETRWQELLAFLISVEQVADRIERMLADLEAKKVGPRLAYPADAQAEVLALHALLALNLRLAAGVCMDRRVAAARDLAASQDAFREREQSLRAAHVARLVAGEPASVAISALHLNLLADLVDMNDQVCAFARRFLELREPTVLPVERAAAGT